MRPLTIPLRGGVHPLKSFASTVCVPFAVRVASTVYFNYVYNLSGGLTFGSIVCSLWHSLFLLFFLFYSFFSFTLFPGHFNYHRFNIF